MYKVLAVDIWKREGYIIFDSLFRRLFMHRVRKRVTRFEMENPKWNSIGNRCATRIYYAPLRSFTFITTTPIAHILFFLMNNTNNNNKRETDKEFTKTKTPGRYVRNDYLFFLLEWGHVCWQSALKTAAQKIVDASSAVDSLLLRYPGGTAAAADRPKDLKRFFIF